MPLVGTFDLSEYGDSKPLVLEPNTEPWELRGAGSDQRQAHKVTAGQRARFVYGQIAHQR